MRSHVWVAVRRRCDALRVLWPLVALVVFFTCAGPVTAAQAQDPPTRGVVQQAQLVWSSPGTDQNLGSSVAVDGNTAFVGAPGADKAFVFTRSGSAWSLAQSLSGVVMFNSLGQEVALSGDWAMASQVDSGGRGRVVVYKRTGGVWSRVQALFGESTSSSGDGFGTAIALAGDVALIGAKASNASGYTASGLVYLFRLESGTWVKKAVISPPVYQSSGMFGLDVALSDDGSVGLVSSSESVSARSKGAVYVYSISGSTCSRTAKLTIPTPPSAGYLSYGYSIALSGDGRTALIGAPDTAGTASSYGTAWTYSNQGGTWTSAPLVCSSGTRLVGCSTALSFDGTTALVGDKGNAANYGSAFLFTRSVSGWSTSYRFQSSNNTTLSSFGSSAAITDDGNTCVIGAPDHKVSSFPGAGSAYVFLLEPGPTITLTGAGSGWQTPPVDLTCTATVASSRTLSTMQYRAKESSSTLWSPWSNVSGSGLIRTLTVPGPGTPLSGSIDIEVRGTDSGGVTGPVTPATVRIDPTTPQIAVSPNDSLWRNTDVTLTFTPTVGPSGVQTVQCRTRTDGGAWGSWQTVTPASGLYQVTITTNGANQVDYRVTNGAGVTTTAAAPATVNIYKAAPTVNVAGNDNNWHPGPVTLTFTPASGPCPIVSVEYRIGTAGAWTPVQKNAAGVYTVTLTPEMMDPLFDPLGGVPNGVTEVYFRTTNAAGTTSAAGSATILFDAQAPETTQTGAGGAWRAQPASVTFTATAGPSGVNYTEYRTRLGTGAWSDWQQGTSLTVPAPIDHSNDGVTSIEYRSVSGAGVVEEAKSCEVKIDTTTPTTTQSGADGEFHSTPVTVDFVATTDGPSGVARTEYRTRRNDGDWGDWTTGARLTIAAPADHSNDGTWSIQYRSVSGAGLVEGTRTAAVGIDTLLWSPQTSGTTQDLNGVAAPDALRAYAVGDNGTILVTGNGGQTWTAPSSGTARHLRAVAFSDWTFGYAVGDGGTVLRTINAGGDWSPRDAGVSADLRAVCFGANTGDFVFAAGDGGTIVRTIDSGGHWSQVDSGTTQTINGIDFLSDQEGCAVGDNGTILRTVNWGADWSAQSSPTSRDLLAVDLLVGSRVAYAVGRGGVILKTDDGSTWRALVSPTTKDLLAVRFTDASNGWVAGDDGTIFSTGDGGATWTAQPSGTGLDLHGLAFGSATVGWAVGESGTILGYALGGSTTATLTGAPEDWIAEPAALTAAAVLAPGRTLNALEYRVRPEGGSWGAWTAVPGSGTVRTISIATDGTTFVQARATDSGGGTGQSDESVVRVDQVVPTTTQSGADGVWHDTAVTVTLTASGGPSGVAKTEYRTNQAGAGWSDWTEGVELSIPAPADHSNDGLWEIQYRSVSGAGLVEPAKTATVGIDTVLWAPQQSGGTVDLHDVYSSDGRLVWAVGSGGTITVSDDGGAVWTPVSVQGVTTTLESVVFSGQNGWAVGAGGTILSTTSGGARWTVRTSGTSAALRYVDAVGSRVWAVGAGGTILASVDGGATWRRQSSPTTADLYGVQFSDANSGIAVGAGGVVLRTTDGGATWSPVVSGTTADLFAVDVLGSRSAWAVGSNGTILVSVNGGASWSPQGSGTTADLYDVDFANATSGWVVGAGGVVACTRDGVAWSLQRSGTSADLNGVAFVNTGTGWAVGAQSTILNFSFGRSAAAILGTHSGWYTQPATLTVSAVMSPGKTLGDLQYRRRTTLPGGPGGEWTDWGSVPGSGVPRSLTIADDGITTVQVRPLDATGTPGEVAEATVMVDSVMPTVEIGGVTPGAWNATPVTLTFTPTVGPSGLAQRDAVQYRIDDGAWITCPRSADSGLYQTAIYAEAPLSIDARVTNGAGVTGPMTADLPIDFDIGVPGTTQTGADGAYHATPVTVDFTATPSGPSGVARTEYRTSRNNGAWTDWTAGTQLVIPAAADHSDDGLYAIQYRSISGAGVVEPIQTAAVGIDTVLWGEQTSGTTADLLGALFIDAQHGWAVGDGGTILMSEDGGASWRAQASGVTVDLHAVAFANQDAGWVVGADGTILATRDGGVSWSPQTSGTTVTLADVFFINATRGWVVGGNGTVLVTTDGGANWAPATSGSSAALAAVFFVDATHGWAVGQGGTVLVTNDGGASWSPQSSGTTVDLRDVFFVDATHGWAVGANGTILATTDGGASWSPQDSGATADLNAVFFVDGQNGWAVGKSGTVLVTGNGGATWARQDTGTTADLQAVTFANGRYGWAVGDEGSVLQYRLGGTTGALISGADEVWHGTPVELTVAAVLAPGRTLQDLQYRTRSGGGDWSEWAAVPGSGDVRSLVIDQDGDLEVQAQATDSAGDSGQSTPVPAKIDQVVPTTTASGTGGWYSAPQTVTFSAAGGPSGINNTEYRIKPPEGDWGPWTEGTELQIPAAADHSDDGVWTIEYRSESNAGLIEEVQSATVSIDTGTPTLVASGGGPAWSATPVTITYTAGDAGPSGLAGVQYAVDGGAWQSATPVGGGVFRTTISSNGSHTVVARARSNSGATSPQVTTQARIDTTSPTSSVSGIPAGWSPGPVTATITATGGPSGIAQVQYSLDGGAWQSKAGSSATVAITGNGSHTLLYRAVSGAGLTGGQGSATIRIDDTVPTATCTPSPKPNNAGWNRTPVTLTLTSSASPSGDGLFYRLGSSGPFAPYTAPISITAQGTTEVQYYAESGAGRRSTTGTWKVSIDTTKPVTQRAMAATLSVKRNTKARLRYKVTDPYSPKVRVYFNLTVRGKTVKKIDLGWVVPGTKVYTKTVPMNVKPGKYAARFVAFDYAGNKSTKVGKVTVIVRP